jgi:transcriptional regulator with XRE-family HTH domain
VSVDNITEWEQDGNMPDVQTLLNISKLFGVSLDFLLNGDQNTQGDRDAAKTLAEYDMSANIRQANLATIQNCTKILTDHKLQALSHYLPQLSQDGLTWVDYGIFDKSDLKRLDKLALLNNNLVDLSIQYFADTLNYKDAVKCDDVRVYKQAELNRQTAITNLEHETSPIGQASQRYNNLIKTKKIYGYKDYCKLSKSIGGINNLTIFVEDKDWALQHLNYSLPGIYQVALHLIDNGAEYFGVVEYNKVLEIVPDVAKTNFVRRVSRDMIKLTERIESIPKE